MNELNQNLLKCLSNSEYSNNKLVFGEGKLSPILMMIGEAPGADEEKQGRPFVGKAGKNLNEFLEIIGLKREDIFISNTVKFRPTKLSPKTGNKINRPPTTKEVNFFLPFLKEEIKIISPKIIVTLGNIPLKAILKDKNSNIGKFHGKPYLLENNIFLFPLYHPASIIYNRALTEVYRKDLEALKQFLNSVLK